VADYTWVHGAGAVDREELSALFRIAPLGDKPPEALPNGFGNSMFMCFVYADGLDCAYTADVAVHPDSSGARAVRRDHPAARQALRQAQEDHPERQSGHRGFVSLARR